MMKRADSRPGFTLIELLIALGIIGIVSTIVLVAVNPYKNYCEAENAKRKVEARELKNAIYQYIVAGRVPPTAPVGEDNARPVCRPGVSDPSCISLDDLMPAYIGTMPLDSDETNVLHTGYALYRPNESASPQAVSLHLADCSTAEGGEEGSGGSSSGSSDASGSGQSSSETSEGAPSSAAASSVTASVETSSESTVSSSAQASSAAISEGGISSDPPLQSSSATSVSSDESAGLSIMSAEASVGI